MCVALNHNAITPACVRRYPGSQPCARDENEETAERDVDDEDPAQTHQGAFVDEFPAIHISVSNLRSYERGVTYRTNGSLIRCTLKKVYSLYPASASSGSSMY